MNENFATHAGVSRQKSVLSKVVLFKPQGDLHSDTCAKSRKGTCANPRKRLLRNTCFAMTHSRALLESFGPVLLKASFLF